MKLPFTWSLSSVWQTATNTIRTTLNLAEKPKKVFFDFCWNVKNQDPIKVILRRFPTKNSQTFNRHCKEYEITFHMNIVKLMAKQHKHHQNDFELGRNTKKSFCDVCWNVKNRGPIKVILRRFPTKNSRTLNRHCEEYEITFHMNIVKLMAKQHKHHQNDFELDWKIENNYVFLLKRQKLGSNQSNIATFSPTILPLL